MFCRLLSEKLNNYFEFEIPKGGMAVWIHLKNQFKWKDVSEIGGKYKLSIGDYQRYDIEKTNHNCIRIGFATFNEDEIHELIHRLSLTMRHLEKVS